MWINGVRVRVWGRAVADDGQVRAQARGCGSEGERGGLVWAVFTEMMSCDSHTVWLTADNTRTTDTVASVKSSIRII